MEQLPQAAAQLLEFLRANGVEAWVVGGAVRDLLLGRPVADWDMTAACTPEALRRMLPDAKPIGGVFGTVTMHGIEITPCRTEAGYTDHRHPDAVAFGAALQEDLARRDFTVNAMAWDGKSEAIDPFAGQADLQERVLRCVGQPRVRFAEDALRILRLYRFAATLGFAPESATDAAAQDMAQTLGEVSAPRVRAELNRALVGQKPSALEPLVRAGGLAAFGLPAPGGSLSGLDALAPDVLVRWWAFIHAVGVPVQPVAECFAFSKRFLAAYRRMDALALTPPQNTTELKRQLLGGCPVEYGQAAAAFAALDARFAEAPALWAALQKSGEPYKKEQLAVTSAQLLEAGVPQRKLSRVQGLLLQAVAEQPSLNETDKLLEIARGLKRYA